MIKMTTNMQLEVTLMRVFYDIASDHISNLKYALNEDDITELEFESNTYEPALLQEINYSIGFGVAEQKASKEDFLRIYDKQVNVDEFKEISQEKLEAMKKDAIRVARKRAL